MSHLMQLEKQILSIKKTKKITHAMQLIAMSLYLRIEKSNAASQAYQREYHRTLQLLQSQVPNWKNPITRIEDPFNRHPLFIVVSSIKGLCGGFNNKLLSYFDRFIQVIQYQKPLFITVGKKATEHVERFIKKTAQGKIIQSYHEVSSNSLDTLIKNIVHEVVHLKPRFSSITVYSTEFKNFFVQQPTHTILVETYEKQKNMLLYPAKKTNTEAKKESDLIWEHDPETMIRILGSSYLHAMLTPLIMSSLVAEQAARFIAMEHATTNAQKYIENLEIKYNKLRQESITKELAEITSLIAKTSS